MPNRWEQLKAWGRTHAGVIAAVIAVFALDRFSKWAAQTYLLEEPLAVFPFFQLRYVENTGASFGMFQGANTLLIIVMAAIIGYMLYSWKELCSSGKLAQSGCVLILAGALGNLYDRIALGYVVDFLDFLVWPVFNVADSAITVGACLLILSLWFNRKKIREHI